MKSQKESVFQAIVELFGFAGGKFEPSKTELQSIYEAVTLDIVNGNVAFSTEAQAKYNTAEKIRKAYVPGMVSNWLRKDKRLNGDVKYVAKNPGSRSGQGDSILKNLKALKSTLTDADHVAAVDEEIANRTLALKAEKAKTVEVDMTKIPEALRLQLGL